MTKVSDSMASGNNENNDIESVDFGVDDIRNEDIKSLSQEIDKLNSPAIICESFGKNPNFYSIVASNAKFHEVFKVDKFNILQKSYDFLFEDIDIDYSSEDQMEYVRLMKAVRDFKFCAVNIAISNHDEVDPQKIRFQITFSPAKNTKCEESRYATLIFENISLNQDEKNKDGDVKKDSSLRTSSSNLLKNLERSLRKERLLREVGALIISDTPINEVAKSVAEILCKHLRADRCLIHDYDDSKTNFVEEFCMSKNAKIISDAEDEGCLKNVAKYINFQNKFFIRHGNVENNSSIFAVEDISSDRNFDSKKELFDSLNIASQIAVTTVFNKEVNGGIYIHQSDIRSWTHDEIELVEMVANQFSIAIDRSKSIEKVMLTNHALMERSAQLKEALKQEKEIRQMQNEFVAMVSHEFKTPLQIIDATRELLIRKVKKLGGDESVDKSFGKIKTAIQRLNGLIQSTLNLAKMESGENKIKVEREIFDLKKFVLEIIDKNIELANNKNIKLLVNIDQLPSDFNGDPKLLDHAFTNIISNAVKYSRNDTKVKVMAKADDKRVIIRVVDQGIGIPKDDLKNIGQKFFRAKNTLEVAGTGIGIYLTKNFIELHKGKVDIASEVNVGTTLTVMLPKIKE